MWRAQCSAGTIIAWASLWGAAALRWTSLSLGRVACEQVIRGYGIA